MKSVAKFHQNLCIINKMIENYSILRSTQITFYLVSLLKNCMSTSKEWSERELDRIIEMAWEDRTPFEAITFQFGVSEQETIEIMRREMKPSSFRMWRKRVQGRATKHRKLRSSKTDRFKCSRQKAVSRNKISKR